MIAIYELLDPCTNECRYIGQTIEPDKRLPWHIQAARRGERRWVYNWIRSILKANSAPIMRIIEQCESDDLANEREAYWIKVYRSYGVDLTNLTDGGGGIRGMKHSEETKAKMGRAHLGKKMPMETILAMSRARTGIPLSPERRAIAIAALRRRVWTQSQKDAISERMRGNTHGLGKKPSPETTAKKSIAFSGENGAGALLSNTQATEIRKRAAAGERQIDLAAAFGVDTITVHRIVMRKTYKTADDILVPGVFWTPEQDHAVRTMSVSEAVQATGKSLMAVYSRRSILKNKANALSAE